MLPPRRYRPRPATSVPSCPSPRPGPPGRVGPLGPTPISGRSCRGGLRRYSCPSPMPGPSGRVGPSGPQPIVRDRGRSQKRTTGRQITLLTRHVNSRIGGGHGHGHGHVHGGPVAITLRPGRQPRWSQWRRRRRQLQLWS